MELVKAMFEKFNPYFGQSGPFGLCNGSCRAHDFIHNGGWYNRRGEKLGWGDLSPDDLFRITTEIEEGEVFVVLGEMDSWDHLEAIDRADGPRAAEYVADKARWLIVRGRLYQVVRRSDDVPGTIHSAHGLEIHIISREDAKKLLA